MRLHFDMLSKSRILGTSQLKALLSEAERQMQELDKAAADAEARAHAAVSAMDTLRADRDKLREQVQFLNAYHADLIASHGAQAQQHEDAFARVQAAATRLQTRVTELERRPTREVYDQTIEARDNWRDMYRRLVTEVSNFTKSTAKFPLA